MTFWTTFMSSSPTIMINIFRPYDNTTWNTNYSTVIYFHDISIFSHDITIWSHGILLCYSFIIDAMLVIENVFSWASYQIRKIAGCACVGNAGNIFPATDFKGNRWLAIPACITARASRTCVPWCMSGSLTRGGGGSIPGACATCKFTYLARGP